MLLHGISDTSYNLRQRMPPAMVFHAGTRTASSYDICLTYITPWQQVRIKINYNAILAQYLVYCQLIATISILLFFTLYKNFSSICLFLSLYFSKWSERYFTSHFHSFFDNWRTYTIMDIGSWWRTPCSWYVRRLYFIAHRAAEDVAGKGIGNGDGRYGYGYK